MRSLFRRMCASRRLTLAAVLLCAWAAPAMANEIASIVSLIRKTKDYLSEVNHASTREYFVSSILIDEGFEPLTEAAKELYERWLDDPEASSLQEHFAGFLQHGEEAKAAIKKIKTDYPLPASASSSDYCAAAEGSERDLELIAELEETKRALLEMTELARAHLNALPSMQEASTAMGDALRGNFQIFSTFDAIIEETTWGTGTQGYFYWTCEFSDEVFGECSRAQGNRAHDLWTDVEKTAKAKAAALAEAIELKKAYHQHFFSAAKAKCAEAAEARRSAAEKEERIQQTQAAPKPARANADCAVLDDMARSEALMQSNEARWLELVATCTR